MNEAKLAFKSLLILICLAISVHQSYILILQYLEFATILNIEIKKSDKFDFPAVSICHCNDKMITTAKQMVQKYPEFDTFINDLINSTLKPKFKKDRAILETLNFSSMLYDRNQSISVHFRRYRIGCKIYNKRRNWDCSQIIKTIHSTNDDLECNTFFSRISIDNYTIDWKLFRDVVSNSTQKFMSEFTILPRMYQKDKIEELFMADKNVFVVVHPYNWLPDKDFNRIFESKSSIMKGKFYSLIFDRIRLYRLPNPYQTNCMEYSESTSQEQSIKDCLKHQMKKVLNCLHFDSILVFNSTDNEYKICNLNNKKWFDYKENFTKMCTKKFRPDCHQLYYNFELIQMRDKESDEQINHKLTYVYLYPKMADEMIYIYSPQMTIIYFIGNLGGIFSLWLGVSFMSLFDSLMNFNYSLLTVKEIKRKFGKRRHKFNNKH